MYRNKLYYLLVLIVWTAFDGRMFWAVHAQSPRKIEPKFEEVLSIGGNESKPVEYLFGEIIDVVTDVDNNIYIATLRL